MKRYPKYKDSAIEWIGEIPEHWIVTCLKRICLKITDGSHFSPESKDIGFSYITVQDIKDNGIDFKNCKYISGEDYLSLKKGGCQPDKFDILLTKDGTIGKAVVIKQNRDFVILSSLGLITPNLSRIISDYLRYYLISGINIDQMFSFIRGSALTRLTINLIKQLHVVYPPIPEQQAIANYLDRKTHLIDTFIENKQKLIDLLKEQRAAIINQAVTKGLNPNVKLKDSDIEWLGEIPEHWELKNFRRICRLQQGLQIAQSERFHETGPNRYEYITVKSFHAGDKYDSREYIENPSKRVICEPDDILLARTGATGEVISGLHGAFHNNFFKVEYDKKKVDKNYLIYYLSNVQIKKYLLLMAGTTTVPDLNHGDFLDAPFVAPNISEQQSIVDYLNAQTTRIDKSIEKQERQIKLLKEYRTTLISEVVTGKIDVRDSGEQEVRHS